MTDHNEFSPGQIMTLKADPAIQGAVMEVLPGQPENRIKVFVEGNIQTYYASQLDVEGSLDDKILFVSIWT